MKIISNVEAPERPSPTLLHRGNASVKLVEIPLE